MSWFEKRWGVRIQTPDGSIMTYRDGRHYWSHCNFRTYIGAVDRVTVVQEDRRNLWLPPEQLIIIDRRNNQLVTPLMISEGYA